LAVRAKGAARQLAAVQGILKNRWLELAARRLNERRSDIRVANEKDLARAPQLGLTSAQVDRLRLTDDRIRSAANGLVEISRLPDPIGRVLSGETRPNGLRIHKVGVPLGVLLFLYESRPNVTVDAAGLAVKSGNAIILRGGKESLHSNLALYQILQESLAEVGLPREAVQLVETTDREVVGKLLRMKEYIDLAIPRGGESLIRRVAAEATMPVLKHFQGICHVYVDRDADLDMALRILINAKCQRPGVCNAAECLLVHREIADSFLPRVGTALNEMGVEMRGCPQTRRFIANAVEATDKDFSTEFLDLIISIRVVENLDEAISHINRYGSKHTDAIVTRRTDAVDRFTTEVDSAAVVVNASTRFHDGFEFGLGAEIGISTDKFHARGPCGLQELTTYKYLVWGMGQIRE
jgi:glutamate-5-semialdehyde dehydrogenase